MIATNMLALMLIGNAGPLPIVPAQLIVEPPPRVIVVPADNCGPECQQRNRHLEEEKQLHEDEERRLSQHRDHDD